MQPDAPREGIEVPDPASPPVASDPPLFFSLVLWIGAFFTLVWGFRVVFTRLSSTGRPAGADPAASPAADDVTLEEPGPDRS